MKNLEKSGLKPAPPNRQADWTHCALSTQPNPYHCWVDKAHAQCFQSARRFGAADSSPDTSRVFHGVVLLGLCLETFLPCTILSYLGQAPSSHCLTGGFRLWRPWGRCFWPQPYIINLYPEIGEVKLVNSQTLWQNFCFHSNYNELFRWLSIFYRFDGKSAFKRKKPYISYFSPNKAPKEIKERRKGSEMTAVVPFDTDVCPLERITFWR